MRPESLKQWGRETKGGKECIVVKLQEKPEPSSDRSMCVIRVPCGLTNNCPSDCGCSDLMAMIIFLSFCIFYLKTLVLFSSICIYQSHTNFDTKNNMNALYTRKFHNGRLQKQLEYRNVLISFNWYEKFQWSLNPSAKIIRMQHTVISS